MLTKLTGTLSFTGAQGQSERPGNRHDSDTPCSIAWQTNAQHAAKTNILGSNILFPSTRTCMHMAAAPPDILLQPQLDSSAAGWEVQLS